MQLMKLLLILAESIIEKMHVRIMKLAEFNFSASSRPMMCRITCHHCHSRTAPQRHFSYDEFFRDPRLSQHSGQQRQPSAHMTGAQLQQLAFSSTAGIELGSEHPA